MIRPPAFWWRVSPTILARLLAPIGWIYGRLTLRRMARNGQRAGCPVICVGNFTTGGSGKTPVAMHVASHLITQGETPFFLSRGYGGSAPGPTRVDLTHHTAEDVGDEPLLLARVAPVIVSPDRIAGAAMALAAGASVIVMDDGLQNPALDKDLVLAVVDARSGFGNGLVFPAGPLRAPVDEQLRHVDALIVIDSEPASNLKLPELERMQLIRARLAPSDDVANRLDGQNVFAMAGIGVPEKFEATLRGLGAHVVGRCFVADHAPYSPAQLADVAVQASLLNAVVATTEKDAARIGLAMPPELAKRLVVVPVSIEVVDGGDALTALIAKALQPRKDG